jgi:hypothetical protein
MELERFQISRYGVAGQFAQFSMSRLRCRLMTDEALGVPIGAPVPLHDETMS